jgi:hypothetical protein
MMKGEERADELAPAYDQDQNPPCAVWVTEIDRESFA